jgi:predicted pyridoxine 5'-phosphate oxidase superfamily flavin-nucleotide-binding protein
MTDRYAEVAFTENVKAVQEQMGSRAAYSRRGPDTNDRIGPAEAAFIAERDGFYMASVSETGWPYVQYRGGPPGFLRVLDDQRLGFADFRGNRQYITTGNLRGDDRVSLFLMDYARRRRLKVFGRAKVVQPKEDSELEQSLIVPSSAARVERIFFIAVTALSWNCPQHITPRFTERELGELFAPFRDELIALRAENARLRGQLADRASTGPTGSTADPTC